MALTEQTKNVQLEIYIDQATGNFTSAVGTKRILIAKDGEPYGKWDEHVSLTLTQVKNIVNGLS